MLESLESCPSCGHQSFLKYMDCEDFTVSHESFQIVQCTNCTLLFTNPRPIRQHLDKYYQSEQYISHTNNAKNLIGSIYKSVRSIALKSKLKLINSLTPKGNLLDYGCGTGHFLSIAHQNNWKVVGIEPSEQARYNAHESIRPHILKSLEDIDKNTTFNIISLWHVLEHISDLKPTLISLANKLEKSGKLVIAVPNPESYDAEHYREYWAAFDVPRHLYHFTQKSLALLLESVNLQIDSIRPMKFDSFYVSLLSEKYKTGKTNYLKSFINGYKSNSYANNNNNNFSSLIYLVSKK